LSSFVATLLFGRIREMANSTFPNPLTSLHKQRFVQRQGVLWNSLHNSQPIRASSTNDNVAYKSSALM
jgi:hypothetical protein